MGNVLWNMELCVSGGIIDEYAKKKKNKFIIPTVCIICMIIIVVTLYIMNNTLYKSLDLTYGNVSKYTITSGSTGNVYDITNEEINNIIEKLNDTKVKEKDFEPTTGWTSYITFSDDKGNSHRLQVGKDRIEYDNVWYKIKKAMVRYMIMLIH